MAITTEHKIEHHDLNKRFVVKGVLEHHSSGELCSENETLTLGKMNLSRTLGGGISYEMEIFVDTPKPELVESYEDHSGFGDAPQLYGAPEPSAEDLDAISGDIKAAEDTSE